MVEFDGYGQECIAKEPNVPSEATTDLQTMKNCLTDVELLAPIRQRDCCCLPSDYHLQPYPHRRYHSFYLHGHHFCYDYCGFIGSSSHPEYCGVKRNDQQYHVSHSNHDPPWLMWSFVLPNRPDKIVIEDHVSEREWTHLCRVR